MKTLSFLCLSISILVTCSKIDTVKSNQELEQQVLSDILGELLRAEHTSNPIDHGFSPVLPLGANEKRTEEIIDSLRNEHLEKYKDVRFVVVLNDTMQSLSNYIDNEPWLIEPDDRFGDKDLEYRFIDSIYVNALRNCSNITSRTISPSSLPEDTLYEFQSEIPKDTDNTMVFHLNLSRICFNNNKSEGVFYFKILKGNKYPSGYRSLVWTIYRPEFRKWIIAHMSYGD